MNVSIPDYHAGVLYRFLLRLRPGDYRDMTDSGEEAYRAMLAVEALREAIAEASEGNR